MKNIEKRFHCGLCKKEMQYGGLSIHSCVTKKGELVDLCTDCWSKHTTDTAETTNLITEDIRVNIKKV